MNDDPTRAEQSRRARVVEVHLWLFVAGVITGALSVIYLDAYRALERLLIVRSW